MSNIILYHSHTEIPRHVFHCIQKIKSYSNIPIYFLTDRDIVIENVKCFNIKKYNICDWLTQLNYFSNDEHENLWKSSCFRLFYIQQFIKEFNIENTLHFDNDVLIFENPEKLIEKFICLNYNFGITAHNKNEVVFGMSFIKNYSSLDNLLDNIKKELELPLWELNNKYENYPNEMRLVSNLGKYETIPVLPESISETRYTNNYNTFNSVFDPSSYGQYLGGIYRQNIPGWYTNTQEIGIHIGNKNISVLIENKNPYIIYKDIKIKINNLHIHSKLTERFI